MKGGGEAALGLESRVRVYGKAGEGIISFMCVPPGTLSDWTLHPVRVADNLCGKPPAAILFALGRLPSRPPGQDEPKSPSCVCVHVHVHAPCKFRAHAHKHTSVQEQAPGRCGK